MMLNAILFLIAALLMGVGWGILEGSMWKYDKNGRLFFFAGVVFAVIGFVV